jgi:serine/threonine-protein kinase
MELLDGLDLESLVRRFGPQPAGRVIFLLRQAAKSLAEAHEKGLVHRDIKPRNIFSCHMGTDYDFVKVLDFGLVKVRVSEGEKTLTGLTRDGVTTGTPAYMAPEAALGRADIDGRADLYSLGCVGYWLLTGQLVFEGADGMAIALAHVQTPPVPPSRRTEISVPRSLEDVILRCLEKDPARRFQTARELAAEIDACRGPESWIQEDAERWWRMHMPREAEPREAAAVLAGTGSSA